MIKTPQNLFVQIYKNMGNADNIDFEQNMHMATDPDYTFADWTNMRHNLTSEKEDFKGARDKYVREVGSMYKDTVYQREDYDFANYVHNANGLQQSTLLMQSNRLIPGKEGDLTGHNLKKKKHPVPKNLLTTSNKYNFQHFERIYIRQEIVQRGNVKELLGIRDIGMIGTPQFKALCEPRQLFDEMMDLVKPLTATDPTRNDNILVQRLARYSKVEIKSKQLTLRVSITGQNYNIPYHQHLFVRKSQPQFGFPIRVGYAKVTSTDMLLLSGNAYTAASLRKHQDKLEAQQKQAKMHMTQDQLQTRLQEIKKEVDMKMKAIKEKRNSKLGISSVAKETQYQMQVKISQFQNYIQTEDMRLVDKIKRLLTIKNAQMAANASHSGMVCLQIHKKLNECLFQLLLTIVAGEKFINLAELMHKTDAVQVEKQVLQSLYQNLHQLEGKTFMSGQTKVKLLKLYSDVRIQIQREGGTSFTNPTQSKAQTSRKNQIKNNKAAVTPDRTPDKRNSSRVDPRTGRDFNRTVQAGDIKSANLVTRKLNSTLNQNSPFNRTPTKQGPDYEFERKIDTLFRDSKPSAPMTARNYPSKSPVKKGFWK